MICFNCDSTMVEKSEGLYECPVCGDIEDTQFPQEPPFEANWTFAAPDGCIDCEQVLKALNRLTVEVTRIPPELLE